MITEAEVEEVEVMTPSPVIPQSEIMEEVSSAEKRDLNEVLESIPLGLKKHTVYN
jgi:hypothetical protein